MGAAFFICRKRHGTRREGFEQPVPAVLRPGGQKSPCGAFLGCGSANPSLSAIRGTLMGAAFFICRKRYGTRREGFEQPVPAVLRPGGQKSPCGAFLGCGSANPSLSAIRGTLMGAAFFICRKRYGTRREGFEQPVPAVLRPGGQKSPCGAFLGCGSANPSLSAMAQRLRALCFLFARNSSRDTQKSAPRCAPNVAAGASPRPTMREKGHISLPAAARAPVCGRHVCRPYA